VGRACKLIFGFLQAFAAPVPGTPDPHDVAEPAIGKWDLNQRHRSDLFEDRMILHHVSVPPGAPSPQSRQKSSAQQSSGVDRNCVRSTSLAGRQQEP
jgi:hypothetical protein